MSDVCHFHCILPSAFLFISPLTGIHFGTDTTTEITTTTTLWTLRGTQSFLHGRFSLEISC